MSTASKYVPHYTVADYERWSGEWELWQGTAVAMTPSPFGSHQLVGANIVRLLGNAIRSQGSDCHVLYEIDWIVSDDTVVRPDVVIISGRVPERHLESAPILIVEILSPSTADKDCTVKRELYEQEGVQHYLIADPHSRTLRVLELQAGVYREHQFGAAVKLKLNNHCQLVVSTSEIWGDE